MRLIIGGNLTSFHSTRVLLSATKHTEKLTMPLECQFIFESKFDFLLYIPQNVGEIADKLGTVGEYFSPSV